MTEPKGTEIIFLCKEVSFNTSTPKLGPSGFQILGTVKVFHQRQVFFMINFRLRKKVVSKGTFMISFVTDYT
jgi:hypothetical protein